MACRNSAVITTCLLTLLVTASPQSTATAYSSATTADLTREAQVVARGKVRAVKSEWNEEKTFIWSFVTLAVSETVKGADQVLNSGSSDTRCAIGYNNSTKKVNAYINTRYGLTDANLITTGGSAVWHHLAVVFDGTYTNANAALQNAGRMKIYIDGVSVALTFPAGDIDSSTGVVSGISIGRAGSTSMTQLTDETGIWSRPLSQAEISLLQSVYPV